VDRAAVPQTTSVKAGGKVHSSSAFTSTCVSPVNYSTCPLPWSPAVNWGSLVG
jgi:hypothetical protein